jgi:hypothetical protein
MVKSSKSRRIAETRNIRRMPGLKCGGGRAEGVGTKAMR